jgi:hypothetical protein
MPRLAKTILPKIKKSLRTRGVSATLWRCVLGPWKLLRQYLKNRKQYVSDDRLNQFDLQHGVETAKRVHLSDLEIASPNWIYADGYWPTPSHVFEDALSGLTTNFENLVFIDFGSGKGRVLLMASEFPFRKIIGVEFAAELHAIAEENIERYRSSTQKCRDVTSVCTDFTQFPIPWEPLFVFLYNPSSREITSALACNIAQSLRDHPRELWVLYVTPFYDVFESGGPLPLRKIKSNSKYALYTNLTE